MSAHLRAMILLLIAMSIAPGASSAQRAAPLVSVRVEAVGSVCALHAPLTGPVWDAILPPWPDDEASFLNQVTRLRDSLRVETARAPTDVVRLHELAAVLGTLTELQGASAKVKTAQDLERLTRRILELDPDHAGTHHIVGRLHAAVMRSSRIERFVATRLLGGSALSSASWETARHHLEIAAARDPCSPQHHYELAKLHVDVGEPTRAADQLRQVQRTLPMGRFEVLVAERAAALLDSLSAS